MTTSVRGLFQNADDVVGRAGRFFDDALHVFAEAIVRHAAMNFHPELRHFGETDGVVRFGEDRFAQIAADLVHADVEGGGELDVAHVIPAELDMHQAGNEIVLAGVAIEFDPLDKGRSAVADPDNTHSNLILHSSTALLKWPRDQFAHSGAGVEPHLL